MIPGEVLTKAGEAVANGTVTWKVTLGGGTVSSETSTTDATGTAAVLWTLGDSAGFNTLSATAFDASTAYIAEGTAGAPSALVRVSADSMRVVAGASLPISVRVTDHLGNGAGGASVQWSTTGGALTIATT